MVETCRRNVQPATAQQPVVILQDNKADAEENTAKASRTTASSVMPTAPTQRAAGHDTNRNNDFEPSMSSPPQINRQSAGNEDQSKPTPEEREPRRRAAAEAAPHPQSPAIRSSESIEGATMVNQSRADEIENMAKHTVGDAEATGAGGNLELKNRSRIMSMSGLEGNSARVRPRSST